MLLNRVRLGVAPSLFALSLFALVPPALAQDDFFFDESTPTPIEESVEVEPLREGEEASLTLPEEGVELDSVEVTGSRIKRVDFEGPLPVTQISRQDIDASGDISVGELLRDQSFNSFGSFTPASGFGGGAAGGQLLSLRGLGAERTLVLIDGRRLPAAPAFSGAAQNLSVIPIAAIERIEVLREGASAVYGSDAIGGVVNIITRKDFEGIQLSGQVERPSQAGGDGANSSIVGGVSNAQGNLFFALDHSQRDIIFSRDRAFTSGRTSPLGGPGSFRRIFADGSRGEWEPMQGCGDTPESSVGPVPELGAGTGCRYDFTRVAAETAATKRDTLTVNGNYFLTDTISGFARLMATRASSFGRFAPAPAFFPNFIQPGNPNNPTAGEAECGPEGCALDLAFRFTSLGNRDTFVDDDVRQSLFGLTGTFDYLGGGDWEVAVIDNRYKQSDIGLNYGLISNFLLASQVPEEEGGFNPFNPSAEAAEFVRHTISTDNLYVSRGADIKASLFEIPGLPFRLPVVVGAEYRDDQYRSQADAQSDAGNVFGSAGGSASGSRTYNAVFAETAVNLIDGLELGFALRRDEYSDFGAQVSPKVSVGYRPLDTLLLRGSFSQGFRAPDLDVLNRPGAQGFPFTIDTLRCQDAGGEGPLCAQVQRETNFTGNPALGPEESDNINVGFVYNVLDDLTVTLDYYRIELEDGIGNLAAQDVLDNEFRCAQEGRACDPAREGQVIRDADGTITLIVAPAANLAVQETDGLDLEVAYGFNAGRYGSFRLNTGFSYVFSFKEQTSPDGGLIEQTDTVGIPDYRGAASLTWIQGPLSSTLGVSHIAATKDCTTAQRDAASAACNRNFASFTKWDAQVNYSLPWQGVVGLGVRNLFDRDPSLSGALGQRYDITLHDLFGRVPYLRYTQTF
jgi:iron complex outermembrane receptor protein